MTHAGDLENGHGHQYGPTAGTGKAFALARRRGMRSASAAPSCLEPFDTPAPAGQRTGDGGQVQVLVRDNNVDQALKALKKKMQREGVFREMKLRRHYEKPSERRAREAAEAVRRARKMERKRLEREGF